MIESEVTRELVAKIVERATRDARIDSIRPWGFTLLERAVFLKQRETRSAYEIRSEVTMITLGVVLESLHLAAAEAGLKSTYRLGGIEDQGGPTPWALVRFAPIEADTAGVALLPTSLSAPPDPAHKLVIAFEKGRQMERARRRSAPAAQPPL